MRKIENSIARGFWLITGYAESINDDETRSDSAKLAALLDYIAKQKSVVEAARIEDEREAATRLDLSRLVED